jgi:excisionase family DNA binding protein
MRTRAMMRMAARRLETTKVSKHHLRNTSVQPGTLATRPAPAAPAGGDDSGVPELDALTLLDDPRLKGEIAEALFGLIKQPTCTVEEAARIWRVCVETVRRDIRKGALRAYRLPGGSLRILRSDLLAYGRPQE